jgi:hypothetical protein
MTIMNLAVFRDLDLAVDLGPPNIEVDLGPPNITGNASPECVS